MFMGCGCHCWPEQPSFASNFSFFDSGQVFSGGSSMADPPGRYPTTFCAACVDNVAPAIVEVTWNYAGEESDDPMMQRPCCSLYKSQSVFRCYASAATTCNYHSLEQAGMQYLDFNSTTGGFVAPVNWKCSSTLLRESFGNSYSRVSMSFARIPTNENLFTVAASVYFYTGYYDVVTQRVLPASVGGGVALYRLKNPDGTIKYLPAIQCLFPHTLGLVYARSPNLSIRDPGPLWFGTQVGFDGNVIGAPCKQVRFSGFDLGLPDTLQVRPIPA
jgi:hypothetical protein